MPFDISDVLLIYIHCQDGTVGVFFARAAMLEARIMCALMLMKTDPWVAPQMPMTRRGSHSPYIDENELTARIRVV